MSESMSTGLVVLHSNQQEVLRSVLVEWLQSHPLPMFTDERILVQSQGIAQWLKLALAADRHEGGLGIAANLEIDLPARFLWQAYRAVLGDVAVPDQSPYDKDRLVWRLFRLFGELPDRDQFSPLQTYLGPDPSQKRRLALARRLADLFDQYQIYRADWLSDWSEGLNSTRDLNGEHQSVPETLLWQPELWRLVRADLARQSEASDGAVNWIESSRADLHQRFLERCHSPEPLKKALPPRVIVFGISALPVPMIEALSALSERMQVMLCVLNPCRHYWADIIEGREFLRWQARRQARKPGFPETLSDETLHLHTQPLLAAWGKQGRDYLRLLDRVDQTAQVAQGFELSRVDLFESPQERPKKLLHQIQWEICELESPNRQPIALDLHDDSLRFVGAHSAIREVEILHDQILAAMEQDSSLRPRDILVMVADINSYRAQIEAVFGRVSRDDPRYLPFTLSDQILSDTAPLIQRLRYLLQLKQHRLTQSELVDLLELKPIQKRFGLDESDLSELTSWIRDAEIRWGLDGSHRAEFGLSPEQTRNSWIFGIDRMLLGYMNGHEGYFKGIEPLASVAGLSAQRAGALAELIHQMRWLLDLTATPKTLAHWQRAVAEIWDRFFDFSDPETERLRVELDQSLARLIEQTSEAEMQEAISSDLLVESWLDLFDELGSRPLFIGGGITFATLMPMRAIPYRRIYLLGMNEGVYPRTHPPDDMDLMALPDRVRPGDRARREDDRYLFLEALLSARDHLSISWIARSVRDNQEQPPSVLVAQLRDYIAKGWSLPEGYDLLDHLTDIHPLQPFSQRYFDPASRLFTYSAEWQTEAQKMPSRDLPAGSIVLPEPLDLSSLIRLMSRPASVYYRDRLGVQLGQPDAAGEETEPLSLTGLEQYGLARNLIEQLQDCAPETIDRQLDLALNHLARSGSLPWGDLGVPQVFALREKVRAAVQQRWNAFPEPMDRVAPRRILISAGGTLISGEIWPLFQTGSAEPLHLLSEPAALTEKGGPRYGKITHLWPAHLFGSAVYSDFRTCLAGLDAVLKLEPVESAEAESELNRLVDFYQRALREPMPLARHTGVALALGDFKRARKAYEGDSYTPGELSQQDELRAHYPSFDALIDAGAEALARTLYGPLIERLNQTFYNQEGSDG